MLQSRSIRLVSSVLGDADLQFFCSRKGGRERKTHTERERVRIHFQGQGLRQTLELRE